jgi:hypothetical protein
LEHDSCKYILSCLVHKENKDIWTKPTEQRAGRTRESICDERNRDIAEERAVVRAEQPMERHGDVKHQMKKMRVEGMQSQLEKNQVERITAQINLLERMKDIYVRMMGCERYKERIVSLMNQMPGMADVAGDLAGTSIALSPATTGQDTNVTDVSN